MQEIGDKLADEILFGRLVKGGTARIGVKGKNLLFNYN
jgi:ATP-dependent Clp protease ATP-binding subunit ClpA